MQNPIYSFFHLTYKSPAHPSLFKSDIVQKNLFQSLRRYRKRYRIQIHDYFFENFHMEALIGTECPHFVDNYLKLAKSEFLKTVDASSLNAPLYFSAQDDKAFYQDEKRSRPVYAQNLLDELPPNHSIERKSGGFSSRYWIREGNVLHWPIKKIFLMQPRPLQSQTKRERIVI